jgi:hypothetical protein
MIAGCGAQVLHILPALSNVDLVLLSVVLRVVLTLLWLLVVVCCFGCFVVLRCLSLSLC